MNFLGPRDMIHTLKTPTIIILLRVVDEFCDSIDGPSDLSDVQAEIEQTKFNETEHNLEDSFTNKKNQKASKMGKNPAVDLASGFLIRI